MSEELKEAIKISLELIIFGIIVLIISIFNGYARSAFIEKNNQDIIKIDISEYRNIYEFSMGKETTKEYMESINSIIENDYGNLPVRIKNGTISKNQMVKIANIITGDDVVRFISKYPRDYNVFIYVFNKDVNNFDLYKLNSESTDEDWNMLSVNQFLEENITKEFYCVFIYDEVLGIYESVVFVSVS